MNALLIPREHGAWSMLFAPFICAVIVGRQWHWLVLVNAAAVFLTFAAKEPLLILARQRFIWKQTRPETAAAKRWLVLELLGLTICGLLLLLRWPLAALVVLGLAAMGFALLAVAAALRNRQRSTPFQIASAFALTSSSLAACLSATGGIPAWGWLLWGLCAVNAAAGIMVVHARLEARIALRKRDAEPTFRKPAIVMQAVLLTAAIAFGVHGQPWLAVALVIAAAANLWDLHRQRDSISLQTPLTRVGLRAMTFSLIFSTFLAVGMHS